MTRTSRWANAWGWSGVHGLHLALYAFGAVLGAIVFFAALAVAVLLGGQGMAI